ncbi:Uncharacterised protein [Mycobacteroides abscessus subsp. abscessus]|nr:Uncharacterised protein [Mycobacteroides abscessus subsp. abscessus]
MGQAHVGLEHHRAVLVQGQDRAPVHDPLDHALAVALGVPLQRGVADLLGEHGHGRREEARDVLPLGPAHRGDPGVVQAGPVPPGAQAPPVRVGRGQGQQRLLRAHVEGAQAPVLAQGLPQRQDVGGRAEQRGDRPAGRAHPCGDGGGVLRGQAQRHEVGPEPHGAEQPGAVLGIEHAEERGGRAHPGQAGGPGQAGALQVLRGEQVGHRIGVEDRVQARGVLGGQRTHDGPVQSVAQSPGGPGPGAQGAAQSAAHRAFTGSSRSAAISSTDIPRNARTTT